MAHLALRRVPGCTADSQAFDRQSPAHQTRVACQMAGRRLRGAQICQTLSDAVVTQAREVKASFHTWLVFDMDGEKMGQEENECLVFSSANTYGRTHTHKPQMCSHTRAHTDTHGSCWILSNHDQIKPQWESQVKISQWWIYSAVMANRDNKYHFCCESQLLSVNKYWNKLLHWKELWKALSKHHRGFWI